MRDTQPSEFWLCYRPFAGDCVPVQMVNEVRRAVLQDTAERAREAGFDRVRVFATEPIADLAVEVTPADDAIGDIVAGAAGDAAGPVCYAGSGMPAMTADDWSAVLAAIKSGNATANRMFSCDWIGVPDGRLLRCAAGEQVDNRFALLIREGAEVEVQSFARSARSLLDVDTPSDLTVLQAAASVGSLEVGELSAAALSSWRELDEPVQLASRVFEVMTRQDEELMISGRISGSDWAVVDRDTSCRVRVLSEERGLRTRQRRARSLLGELYEWAGQDGFLLALEGMGDATIWDTRPFLSHLGWNLSRCDRFWADLGCWERITDKRVRSLVSMLEDSAVLMGGHSLVSGGLLAGIDAAWTQWETGRKLSG
ncbi:MAG: hypothetical protein F4Z51_04115 [Chloroflexi bacterium]|nr:hypothetical protein [Chloroflexota bacterium]